MFRNVSPVKNLTFSSLPIAPALDLFPRIAYSNGSLVSTLVASGVYRYLTVSALSSILFSGEGSNDFQVCTDRD